jgi:transcriptional regulator with XRE-family HTH domain
MEKIKEKIEKLLAQKGISQKKFATMIEMSESGYIQMFDKGSIKVATLEKIASVLDVETSYFLSDNENLKPTQSKFKDFGDVLLEQMAARIKDLEINNQLLRSLVERQYLGKPKSLIHLPTFEAAAKMPIAS